MLEALTKLIDAGQIAGWARSAVAVILGAAAGWSGGKLAPFLTPELQAAVGVVVSTIVVGIWSSIAKTVAAK